MPIITEPPATEVSVYRPVQFEVFVTGNNVVIIQNAVVDLYVNGSLVSTFRIKPSDFLPDISPGTDEYRFCIDVAERLRDLLGPNTNLPSQFVLDCPTIPTENTDAVNNFYLEITYEYLDANDNIIKPLTGITDITSIKYGVSITRQHLENMYLGEFFPTFPTLGKMLTKSPQVFDVCRTDNRFLSILTPQSSLVNAFRVTLYDSAGSVIGTQDTLINASVIDVQMFTINTGIENGLKCITGTQQTPSYDLDDPNIFCYTVQFGLLSFGGYTPLMELYKYNLTDGCKCCEKRIFKLHWLNCLGGVDSYEFCSIKELKQKSTAIIAERSLAWDKTSLTPNNITDVGIFKKQTTNEQRFRIVSRDLSNTTANWLSEMLGSVKVYLEIETNKFVPVIIENSDQLINVQSGKIKFELTVRLAYCIIKQNV